MRTLPGRFAFYLIVVLFSFAAFKSASGSVPPQGGNAAPIELQHDSRRFARSLANADAGEPRTVRLIYFLPNDKDYRPQVVQRMKDEIRRLQTFFEDQMRAHGHGAKTFRFETDAQGEPVVHRVNGQHRNSYYHKDDVAGTTLAEIELLFDVYANIYLIVIDNHRPRIGPLFGVLGYGLKHNKTAGYTLLPGEFTFKAAAHELGHAFGLHHDFHDDAYIMSYGEGSDELSACSASFLAVHPYFDSNVPVDDVLYDHEIQQLRNTENFLDSVSADRRLYPTIELISSLQYPKSANSVTVRLNINDSNGVHRVLLYVKTEQPHKAAGFSEVFGCQELAGEKNAVIRFDYDGVIPSSGIGSLSDPTIHPIWIEAVDLHGNVSTRHVRLYEATLGHFTTLTEHTKEVSSLAFSPDGGILASASYDNRVILWDVAMGKKFSVLHDAASFVEAPTSLAYSPDGKMLAVGTIGATVMLWDMVTRSHIDTLVGHDSSEWVTCVAFSPDGKILASGSGDQTIRLWNAMTGNGITTLEGHTHWVTFLSFSRNGNLLASGSHDATIKLWNTETEEIIDTLEGHTGGIRSISFSQDGRTLASTASDFTVKLWDIETTRFFTSIGGPRAAVHHTSFSPVENILVLGGGRITLFDFERGTPIATLGIPGPVGGLTFSRDGTHLAASTWDGFTPTIELWDTSAWVSLGNQMIPDANLRRALRISLDKATGATITQTDLAMLTELSAWDASIIALVGLEYATNLEYLYLGGNNIVNLLPIAGLTNLGTLFLQRNSISDITPLARLTNLTSLYLYDNNTISDLSPLKRLTKLTVLDLSNNNITDIAPLSALNNLEQLFLAGNRVTDTSALAGLTKLITLHLAVNSISDISPSVANWGLGEGDTLLLRKNPLNYEAVNSHIPLLQDRGVTVSFDDRTPTTLQPISGGEQQGATSEPLTDPFVVEVRDEHGDVFEGVPVTFSVPEGGGRLSATTTTTDANGRAQSILTLGELAGTITVTVSAAEITEIANMVTFRVVSEATPPRSSPDVNGDGVVNIQDVVLVLASFGDEARHTAADVNRDGVVNVLDVVLVIVAIGEAGAAPSAHPQILEQLSAADVREWLNEARSLGIHDDTVQRGMRFLEQLLAALTPDETALLPNYPNPFNPETWIPYHLAQGAKAAITIYDVQGALVRRLALGYQAAGYYSDRGRAAYWDGRNESGEAVANGVYFYRLRAEGYSAVRRMAIVK